MAKTTTIDQLAYAAAGPKKPAPTYQFGKKTFKEHDKQPGQHEKQYDYTIR